MIRLKKISTLRRMNSPWSGSNGTKSNGESGFPLSKMPKGIKPIKESDSPLGDMNKQSDNFWKSSSKISVKPLKKYTGK